MTRSTQLVLPFASLAALVALALLVLQPLAGTALAQQNNVQGTIAIAGSSTVGPVTMSVVEEFNEAHPEVAISNAVTGTGGGFKRFTAGETDISNASRPIKPAEVELAKKNGVEFIELPVAFDGLTIAVSRKNTFCTELSVDELRKIFLADSQVYLWSDIRDEFPDRPIQLFIPGTDSGTFDYFKEVVAGKEGNIRSDLTVSEDDNLLVKGVAENEYALGFFGCAYYFKSRDQLNSLKISHEGGEPVKPTHDTIEDGSYAPFSRPLFIYVNTKAADRPEVRAFVEFYMRHGGRIAEEVGYVQLPRALYVKAFRDRFIGRQTGTAYVDEDGVSVHPTLREQFGME